MVKAMLTSVMILLITVASESVLARGGHSGGGRSGGGHSGGSHFGGGHLSSGHFSGRGFRGPPVRFGVIVAAPAFFYYPPLHFIIRRLSRYLPHHRFTSNRATSNPRPSRLMDIGITAPTRKPITLTSRNVRKAGNA